ncbi:hypothetical protein [Mycobacterium sp.]|jgi:uncharacterized protein YukE|uniref:hypothetical protein n=1 Tax=Mycobacterium sp. TaxID=1785 RepID=UPI0025E5200E|nr:hypothetical protein [Mycobacterium sp.]
MDSMRYDHPMMADHVAAQAQLTAHMTDLKQQAMNAVQHAATIWTQHGSDAAQVAFNEINQAFNSVFETINRHGAAIGHASTNAQTTDFGVKAGFQGL